MDRSGRTPGSRKEDDQDPFDCEAMYREEVPEEGREKMRRPQEMGGQEERHGEGGQHVKFAEKSMELMAMMMESMHELQKR